MKYVTCSLCRYIILGAIGVSFLSNSFWNLNCSRIKFPRVVYTKTVEFEESSKQLNNPYRGFYMMYGFVPNDFEQNFQELIKEKMKNDPRELAMIQINLRNYTERPLSQICLENIEDIFKGMKEVEKQYIVRFMYDWNGNNLETEPTNVENIFLHMQQLKDVLHENSNIIYILQGIFIGNWGEMNGTKHLGEMQRLTLMLASVTGENTYLAVRMPAQWRKITGWECISLDALERSSLVRRLSLFNDGIMGNEGDYGTYSLQSKTEVGMYSAWNREEELEFQEELCKYVPNGGEVIVNNSWNDFENAIQTLSKMHVSYLNLDYDQNVLNKWEKSTVTEEGCFLGMDGLSYVERHLGYRLLIQEVFFKPSFWADKLKLEVEIQNLGFSPLYKEPETYITIINKETDVVWKYAVETNIRSLVGGFESEKVLKITQDVSIAEFPSGEYEVYFSIYDRDSGKKIELANEQSMQLNGYRLGEFSITKSINLIDTVLNFEARKANDESIELED